MNLNEESTPPLFNERFEPLDNVEISQGLIYRIRGVLNTDYRIDPVWACGAMEKILVHGLYSFVVSKVKYYSRIKT